MNKIKFKIKKIKDIPTDPKIMYAKASLYIKLGKIDDAIELLTQASINHYDKAQYTLAKLYQSEGNIEECEKLKKCEE